LATLLPNSTTFTLDFDGQVPIQIRRSVEIMPKCRIINGTMVSKLAEFDFEGWHADPYIAREFHGVWEILMSKLRSIKTTF
jgi:hypothetical protein